jgi:hypothetical protein
MCGYGLLAACQKKAVVIAVRNVSDRRRWSKLAEWLSALLEALRECMMSGVTVPPWRSWFCLASRKCGTSQLHFFKHGPVECAPDGGQLQVGN